jgi:phosphopantothenoylcysteine decarboxylase/phosphopantothenate--cysteine ligase
MLEPLELVDAVAGLFATGALSGRRVLITAGPTREPIDPVRYLTNRSSGRMGFALAEAAAEAGAEVTLVAGPCALATPCGVARVDIETAAEMQAAVLANIAGQHLFIGAAAIADYRPTEAAAQKIKKQQAELNMELEPTTDVLAEVAARADRPFVVGFAAETERLAEHAREKLARKRLDLVFANRVGPGLGFEVEHNAIEAYWVGGERSFPVQSKARLARALVALIAERLDAPARLRVAP